MKRIILLMFVLALGATYLVAQPHSALAANVGCADGTTQAFPVSGTPEQACADHGGVDSASQAQGVQNPCASDQVQLGVSVDGKTHCISNDPKQGGAIIVYLRLFLKFLSGVVGIVILMMLIIAGIQYITSTGDPGQVKAAKNRIINAITGLVLFLSAFAILSFIIPGGIF